eukprot:2405190-Rhodomonas_salina.1
MPRVCYAMSGTDYAYAATRSTRGAQKTSGATPPITLRTCYAMSSTVRFFHRRYTAPLSAIIGPATAIVGTDLARTAFIGRCTSP